MIFQHVFDLVKRHPLLNSKGEKVNLGKYHHSTFNGRRPLPEFALRGFYFGIASAKFGYKGMVKGVPIKQKPPAAQKPEVDKPTLKQSAELLAAESLSVATQNQLDRASILFSDINVYYKMWIATSCLNHTANYHSAQAVKLRSNQGVIEWELTMMKGAMYDHVRLTVLQPFSSKFYTHTGIEGIWSPVENICVDHPRVAISDQRARQYWDICMTTALELIGRNLPYMCGVPKRQTLLLDEDPAVYNGFIAEFKADCENSDTLMAIEDSWAVTQQKRNCFNKVAVIQLRLCLMKEGWTRTFKLQCFD